MDEVVAAGADEADQAGQGGQVAVAVHAEVHDRHPVGDQPVGDRARVGQGHDLAVQRQVAQQQTQLLLGTADAETGDDVQDLDVGHGSHLPHRTPAQPVQPGLQQQPYGRVPLPDVHPGRACRPVSGPGSMAQA